MSERTSDKLEDVTRQLAANCVELDDLRAELGRASDAVKRLGGELARLRAMPIQVKHDVTPTGQLVVHVLTGFNGNGEIEAEDKPMSLQLAAHILQGQGMVQVKTAEEAEGTTPSQTSAAPAA